MVLIATRGIGGCCQSTLLAEPKETCANAIVILVALAALAAAIIGALAVSAHLPGGAAGLGAISELSLSGGIALLTIGAITFMVFASCLAKRRFCKSNTQRIRELEAGIEKRIHERYLEADEVEKKRDFFLEEFNTVERYYSKKKTYDSMSPLLKVKKEESPINTLPDEVLLGILEYLDDKSLIRFGHTNKKFYGLIKGEFPFCFIKIGLRTEALSKWKKHHGIDEINIAEIKIAEVSSDILYFLDNSAKSDVVLTIERLVPTHAQIISEEIKRLLDSIDQTEEKFPSLIFIALSLNGMFAADSQHVLPHLLQLFSITYKLESEGIINRKQRQNIVGVAYRSLKQLPSFSEKYKNILKNERLLPSHPGKLVENLSEDTALIYLTLLPERLHEEIPAIMKKILKVKDKKTVLEAITHVRNKNWEKYAPRELAAAHLFIGEFENACALSNEIRRDEMGKLIELIATHSQAEKHLFSLLKWTKELLSDKDLVGRPNVENDLIRAVAIIIKKIGKKDPIIDEIIKKYPNDTKTIKLMALCLSSIDSERSFQLAKQLKERVEKIVTLVALAKEWIIPHKELATACLDLAFEVYTHTSFKTDKYQTSLHLFQVAELYALINPKRAEQIFECTLKGAKGEFPYCEYTALLPLIKADVAIQKAYGRDPTARIDFIKTQINPSIKASLLAKLAEEF